MKISIITACLNGAKTIHGTLRSVLSQTWPDVEHIIIDGASTDDTLEIIRGCSARVSRLISEPDKGIYDAMNKGLTVASGQVVAFLNADDMYSHSRVLARVAKIMEGEQLDAVYGDAEFFHPDYPDHKVFYNETGLVGAMEKSGFGKESAIHMPLKSAWLDRHLRPYCI